jgi:cytochrome c biogenesis protein CcmG/thiol:disulfide interchange protein DsbE
MSHLLKGLLVTFVAASLMYIGWLKYKDFLTQGMRPTASTLILNKLEEDGLPLFEAVDIKGNKVVLSEFSNRLVIINFWASWCAPCVKEFPSMIRLLKQFPDDMVLLAFSHDKTFEDLESFASAFEVDKVPNFVVLWDQDKAVAKEFGTEVLPESFIIRPGLKLERKVVGIEEWDVPLAIEYFKSLISKAPTN